VPEPTSFALILAAEIRRMPVASKIVKSPTSRSVDLEVAAQACGVGVPRSTARCDDPRGETTSWTFTADR
jgi:hypothetical protein